MRGDGVSNHHLPYLNQNFKRGGEGGLSEMEQGERERYIERDRRMRDRSV